MALGVGRRERNFKPGKKADQLVQTGMVTHRGVRAERIFQSRIAIVCLPQCQQYIGHACGEPAAAGLVEAVAACQRGLALVALNYLAQAEETGTFVTRSQANKQPTEHVVAAWGETGPEPDGCAYRAIERRVVRCHSGDNAAKASISGVPKQIGVQHLGG